jgi:CheY-like chemotaxis protein
MTADLHRCPRPAGRPRVLIVEDEPRVRAVVAIEFRDVGYEVVVAATGDEARDLLGGQSFDLLFTDVRMPGSIDGWQLAVAARALQPGIAVIYATGYSDEPEVMVEGALFFRKPYHLRAVFRGAETLGVLPQA